MRAILALSCSLTVARARTGASRRDGAGLAAATCLDVEAAGCWGRGSRPNEYWALLQPQHCGTGTSGRYIRGSLPVKQCLHSHANPGMTSLGCAAARLPVILAANWAVTQLHGAFKMHFLCAQHGARELLYISAKFWRISRLP